MLRRLGSKECARLSDPSDRETAQNLCKSTLQELIEQQLASAELLVATTRALAEHLGPLAAASPRGPADEKRVELKSTGCQIVQVCGSLHEPLLDRSRSPGPRVAAAPPVGDLGREAATARPTEEPRLPAAEGGEGAKAARMPMFPDPATVKEQVSQALRAPNQDAEHYYHDKGFWQALARSNSFKNLTFGIIALNAIWIGVDTDLNKHELLVNAPWEFQVAETTFCLFFSFEIMARFKAFRVKCRSFKDFWFVFDGSLLVLMWWGSWGTSAIHWLSGGSGSSGVKNVSMLRILRLFRLLRVARVARLLKDIPELMVLIKGMALAIRAVFSTLCLLLMTIYVFAIAFTQLLAGGEGSEGCFETVPQAMNCLLLNGVFSDQSSLITQMLDIHWAYYVGILIYMTIGSLTVLNMLIGVMCDVISTVSQAETQAMTVQSLMKKITTVLQATDTDHDQVITSGEFKLLLQSAECMQALDQVNIEVPALVDFADFIFWDKSALTTNEFVDMLLQFRGDNIATVKDLVDIRRLVTTKMEALSTQLEQLCECAGPKQATEPIKAR